MYIQSSDILNYEKEYMLIIKYAQSAREDVLILRIKKKKRLTRNVLTIKKQNITLRKFVMFYYIDSVIFFPKMF